MVFVTQVVRHKLIFQTAVVSAFYNGWYLRHKVLVDAFGPSLSWEISLWARWIELWPHGFLFLIFCHCSSACLWVIHLMVLTIQLHAGSWVSCHTFFETRALTCDLRHVDRCAFICR
jgi:uncharacterized membrane protein YecN with MAPEG domain